MEGYYSTMCNLYYLAAINPWLSVLEGTSVTKSGGNATPARGGCQSEQAVFFFRKAASLCSTAAKGYMQVVDRRDANTLIPHQGTYIAWNNYSLQPVGSLCSNSNFYPPHCSTHVYVERTLWCGSSSAQYCRNKSRNAIYRD